MTFRLYTDGGARGNPGPGGIGVVIENAKGEIVYESAKYVGRCTNNEAEYMGVLAGLENALERKMVELEVFLDSELVIKQLRGEYKVKNTRLKEFYLKAKSLEKCFKKITYTHIKREKNKKADALVNEALDQNGF